MIDEISNGQSGGGLPRQSWTAGLRAAIDSHRHANGRETPRPRTPLGQVLLRSGSITDADINRALADQAKSGKLIGEILVDQGAVSRPVVTRALEEQAGGPARTEAGLFSGLRRALGKDGPEPS
jgi:hypothetical protein